MQVGIRGRFQLEIQGHLRSIGPAMKAGGLIRKLALAVTISCARASGLWAAVDPFLTLDTVVQTNGQLQFNLNGEDGVNYVIEGSSDLQNWTPVLTNNDQPSIRTITVAASNNLGFCRASRGPLPLFSGAITARSNITFNGNFVTTDSFDSSDTNDFPGGQYNKTNRESNGNVASGYGLVSIGNANIMGMLFTGPSGNLNLGPDGVVGDVAYVTNGNTGIEPGWYINDFRFCLPDVQVPYTNGLPLPPVVSNYYVLSSGQYYVNGGLEVPNSRNFLVTGQAALYVTGTFSLDHLVSINIRSNASLTLFVGGAWAEISKVNNSGGSGAFQYYGLPGNTSFAWDNVAVGVGTVYAPEANVTLSGRGITNTDFTGSFVGNSFLFNGEVNIHYDENLAKAGPQR